MYQQLTENPASTLVIGASLAVFSAWVVRSVVSRFRDDVRKIRGPSGGSWIWGHEIEAFENPAGFSYTRWLREFGPVIKIRAALWHGDILVVADNVAAQHILQECYTFVKSPVFRPPIDRLIGKGLVWAEGDDHKKMRKLLTPAFTAENVRQMAPDIYEATARLQINLANHISSNGGSTVTNIVPWTSATTLDIIGRVGFAHDFTQGDEFAQVHAAWNEHVDLGKTKTAFVAPVVIRAFPFITSLPVKTIQAQGKVKTMVKAFGADLVRRNEEMAAIESEKKKDILSLLLRANTTNALTTDQILDNITTFVMVGNETSAGALTFALWELARHPSKQQKLREELVSQIRGGDEASYDDFYSKFPYLDAVIRETLRIHPSSPYTERIALKDSIIPLRAPITTSSGQTISQIKVSAGQNVLIPFISMHTLESIWGEDASKWIPERWLPPNQLPPSNTLPQGWGNLCVFADGPRNCIGYRLALFEMKVILSSLIRHFNFEDTGARVVGRVSPTLQPMVEGVDLTGANLPLKVSFV